MSTPFNWGKPIRWALLLGGLASTWWTMGSGEMPYCAWLGIASVIFSSALGVPLAVAGGALGLFFLRYALFLTPIARMGLQNSWGVSFAITIAFAVWEAAPLWVAGALGMWGLRRRSIPGWALLLLVAFAHVTLAAWLPRPYDFSWGAIFLSRFPSGIWMFGADLLAGLVLGWLCLAARFFVDADEHWSFKSVLITGVAPVVILGSCEFAFAWWRADMLKAPKERHEVIALQGGVAPFAGGFAFESERGLLPVVLFSSLRPDLLMLPENFAQVVDPLDPKDEISEQKRHVAAVGMGIAAPYSQVLFGIRDWNTSRIYFTDLVNDKPDVLWKDMEHRRLFLDYWPSWADGLVKQYGFKQGEQLRPAQRTPMLSLLIRDETQPRGLRRIGSGLIAMSGEARFPRLVEKIRNDKSVTVLLNPTIGGWLGVPETRGSVLQANARSMELGLMTYRAGQLAGTGFFVPWQATGDEVQQLGPGILRFNARVPLARPGTGYTKVFWASIYAAPFGLLFLALGLILNALRPSLFRARAASPDLVGSPA